MPDSIDVLPGEADMLLAHLGVDILETLARAADEELRS